MHRQRVKLSEFLTSFRESSSNLHTTKIRQQTIVVLNSILRMRGISEATEIDGLTQSILSSALSAHLSERGVSSLSPQMVSEAIRKIVSSLEGLIQTQRDMLKAA